KPNLFPSPRQPSAMCCASSGSRTLTLTCSVTWRAVARPRGFTSASTPGLSKRSLNSVSCPVRDPVRWCPCPPRSYPRFGVSGPRSPPPPVSFFAHAQRTPQGRSSARQREGSPVNHNRYEPAASVPRRRRSGCAVMGCGVVVVALLSIIALVGFLVADFTGNSPIKANRLPIPDDVPPAAAAPAPDIDIHQPGRTANQLARWARGQVSETNSPCQALIAYGNAENIARQTRPECGLRWNTLAGLGFVETKHGSYAGWTLRGTKLNDQGTADPKIFGP